MDPEVMDLLLRKTFTSYAWDSDPNHSGFQTAHILDRPYKVQVIDSDGVTVDAGVTYLYDSVANLTDYQQWLNNTGSSYLDTHHGYDGYGNITSTIDPAGNPPTNYSYTDNFAVGCPGVNASSAYLTQITYPSTGVAHIEKFSYNCPSGKLASSIDQNSVPTYYQYNDAWSRLTEIDYFNTGFKRYSYNDSAPSPSVTETSAITSGQQKIQTSIQDGLGHVVETDLNSDPEGTDIVKTAYDGLGLKWTQTNPYRTTYDGTVQYQYDSLGRLTTQTQQDNGAITYSYSGNTTTITDEAQKSRKTLTDALGRVTNVWEDPGSLNYVTVYQYDALGNLKCAEQHGNTSSTGCSANPSYDDSSSWRVRRFSYDMLSRLKSAKNPESGTYTYEYDSDIFQTCSVYRYNGELIGRIDSKGIGTCMQYDALHRVVQKSYHNASDPPVKYCYDNQQTACGTTSVSYGVGRRTGMSDGSGNTAWGYDSMGFITAHSKAIGSFSKSISYQRNLDESLSALTYPDGSSRSICIQQLWPANGRYRPK